MNTKLLGDQGEDKAAAFLVGQGYHIIKRNLRCRAGEVDIVVYRDDCLIFVEVKSWRTVPIHDLERSITKAKRSRILGCAREFVSGHPEWDRCQVRFDIIHVGPDKITHFDDAFTENGFQ